MEVDSTPKDPPAAARAGRWLAPPAAALVLLCALAGSSVSYEVGTRDGVPYVRAFGETFSLARYPRTARGLVLSFGPQDRHSTAQALVRERGLLSDGLRSLAEIVRGRKPDERTELRLGADESGRFRHVNPFRATVELKCEVDGGTTLPDSYRLEVNVPDRTLEEWYGTEKLRTLDLPPPGLALTLLPLLASAATAALALSLCSLLAARRAEPPDDTPRPPRPGTATVAVLLAAGGAVAGTALFLGVFGAVPGFGDEINYLFQGKIFAGGRTWVPEPPLPEFFRVDWMDLFGTDGRLWDFHPPGNSALLALGWLVGARWVTVPLVLGLNLATTWLLGVRLFRSRGAALLAVALAATSHYFLALSCSFMAHAPSYLFLSLGWLLVLRFRDDPRPAALGLAGAAFGAAFVVRPLSAVLGALVPIALVLARPRRHGWRALAAGAAGGLAVSSLAFLYTLSVAGRFDLPYLVKGPEAGQTLSVRLKKEPGFARTNLYRNLNELQHRVHSFGILLNTAPFFVPAVALWRRRRRHGVAAPYAAFGLFVVIHSVLHWYGWKWEPRMLFDVAFLFFLVSGRGLEELLHTLRGRRWASRAAAALLVVAAGWVVLRDLPERARTEYRGYNTAPTGVREAVRRQRLSGALVFVGQKDAYASYFVENGTTFDGDVVYAMDRGEVEGYRLVSRFPERTVWTSSDGMELQPRENFLRSDAARLGRDLAAWGAADATVVVPWCRVAPSARLESLPGRVVDPGEFLADLAAAHRAGGAPRLAALVGSAAEMAPLVDGAFATTPVPANGYDGRIAVRRIDPASGRGFGGLVPGLRMTCYAGTRWEGEPLSRRLVASFDLAPCAGEERSIRWEAEFQLAAARTLTFTVASDDGSAVFLDGRTVVDNGLDSEHSMQERTGEARLEAGRHRLEVKYFNGPAEASLSVEVALDGGPRRALTATSHPTELLLAIAPEGPASGGSR